MEASAQTNNASEDMSLLPDSIQLSTKKCTSVEIQKYPAAVAHRQMLAVHARQFPAAQRAGDQRRQQRPVPHSANAVRVRCLQ
jgi:hypothetical protein